MKKIYFLMLAFFVVLGIVGQVNKQNQALHDLPFHSNQLVEVKPINQASDFRAVWVTSLTGDIASYSNVTQYQTEINKVFAVMEYYNMNVMVFHIRTHNNALYKSSLNPVASYYRNVNFDAWDPIAWIIEQCHLRGMEFHAWLNPYRCSTTFSGTTTQYAANQPSYNIASNPENLLKTSNGIILNPGEPAVRQFLVDTCMEVIERYDVDAIHFDDYFYADGVDDTTTRSKYNQAGLSVEDFRRQQVDLFIEKLSQTMRAYNLAHHRLVQLGVAPTGIYRNSSSGVETVYDSNGTLITPIGSTTGGWQHYGSYLFCDTKKWIDNEWIDYIIPQSYWGFTHPTAGYINVMSWWAKVVKYKNVNLYSGMGLYMAGSSNTYSWVTDPMEASKQIDYAKTLPEVQGHCIFSYKHIKAAYDQNPGRYLENMKNVKNNNWTNEVLVPEIRTYEAISLPSVASIAVAKDQNAYVISFPKVDGAKFYALYRGTKPLSFSADELLAVTSGPTAGLEVTYVDEIGSGQYFYGVRPVSITNTLGGTAMASSDVATLRVRFLDDDGSVLKVQYLLSGGQALAPSNPTKEGFDFVGWDHELSNITESIDIRAQYSVKMLTVTFKDHEQVLATVQVPYGGTAEVSDPVKEGHVFDGWLQSLENIKQNTVIYASFSPFIFTVVFLGRDGLALKTEQVAYGDSAVAPIINDSHFTAWNQSFANVTSDLLITPLFDDAFKLIFKVDDQIIHEVLDAKGPFQVPSIPFKEGHDQQPPVWSITDFSTITEDTIITPIYYINTFSVTFLVLNNKVLSTEIVKWQQAAPAPTNTAENGYSFQAWNQDFSTVTADATITAIYDINKFTVTFLGLNGKVLSTEIVNWQQGATAPTNTAESGYSFQGWDRDFSCVSEDMTVKGRYLASSTNSCSGLNLPQLTYLLVALAWLLWKRRK
ncbi:MAG TPA: family 10 glycosylhydrolase [Bacilli bacterium]|nr:family 10 glycosylhydrolase [Bacilli bacterium]